MALSCSSCCVSGFVGWWPVGVVSGGLGEGVCLVCVCHHLPDIAVVPVFVVLCRRFVGWLGAGVVGCVVMGGFWVSIVWVMGGMGDVWGVMRVVGGRGV